MIHSQQIILRWIECAAAGAMLLVLTNMIVGRLRQPTDRINLILMTFLATALVPPLVSLAPVPVWHLGLVTAGEHSETKRAAASPHMLASPDLAREPRAGRERLSTHLEEPTAIGSPIAERPRSLAPAAPTKRFDPWGLAAAGLFPSYGLAAALFIAEWFISARRLRKIATRSLPAGNAVEDVWMGVTDGRGGRIPVRISTEIAAPLVYGCLRPTVVIPESIAAGELTALRFCLIHEWSHIVNGDLRVWRMTWACQFLLWFQPLYWILRREMRDCQDFLADHRAADAGRDRIEYSELLLALVRQRTGRPIVGAIALFDRSSQLSRRINMLLSSSLALRSRSPLTFCVASGILSLVCAVLFGAIRLDSVLAGEVTQSTSVKSFQEGTTNPASAKPENGDNDAKVETKAVRGRVIDESGRPVGGTQLWLLLRYQPRRVVQATTDESGQFELRFPATWISQRAVGSGSTIWAYAPGHSIATQNAYKVVRGKSVKDIEIILAPQSNTRFKVLTPTGEPFVDAHVQPQNYKTSVGYDLVPEEMLQAVSARTDTDGIATLTAIQPEPLSRIRIVSEKFGKQTLRVDRDAGSALRDIRLRDTGRIEGRLVGERPEWLRGVRVTFATDNSDEWNDSQGEASVVTDDNGHFEVPIIASGGPLHTYLELDPSLPVRPRLNDNLYVASDETLQLDIPLEAAPKVFGKVLIKSSGKPLANAEISLGYGGFRQHDSVVTNESGKFEGRSLPGPVRMHCISLPGGYVQLGEPWEESYQVPTDVQEFELPTIEVVGTRKVTGQLIGANDQPLPDMQVMAVDKNRRYGFAKTDTEGRFTMNVPDGVETNIEVYSDGRGQEPVTVIKQDPLVVRYAAGAAEEAIDAEREAKADVMLTGRVLSDERPLAGVQITLSRGIPVESVRTPGRQGGGMRIRKIANIETDADGRFRLTGLKAGDSYQIEVRPTFPAADPSWRHQSPWMPKLPDNAQGEVALPDLKLRKLNQSLSGIVVDPDGNPVAGAQVNAQLRDGYTSIPRNSRAGPPPWTETDKEGRFKLQQLPDEPLAIMAYIKSKGGGRIRFPAKVSVELNQQDIRIVLDPSLVEEE